jgi:ABC-type antimicrobial peptide transport system permease subunit
MIATLLEILMILSLGILAGTGTGLFIGYLAGKQKDDWAVMEKKDIVTNVLFILVCSVFFIAVLAWYLYGYPVT